MVYITAREAAEKWGVSGRAINYHLSAGRIPGAFKKGELWLIPAHAQRPADKRKTEQKQSKSPLNLQADLIRVSQVAASPMPAYDPDSILTIINEDRVRLIYEAELSYLRGDFEQTMVCFHKTVEDDAVRLRACPIAIAAAISLGDYNTYTQIESYLKRYINTNTESEIKAAAEFSLATTAVSVLAPNMAPDWLKTGDFSCVLAEARPNALYLRAKYFYCIGEFHTMLAVAQTALTLSSPEPGITMTDLYLRIICAVACFALERIEESKRWLVSAMHLALPHGFITPFSEYVPTLGRLMEQCIEQEFPKYYKNVMKQWEQCGKNWIIFHNHFTMENITLILSLREYQLAMLVARGISYAKIAKQYGISIGRLKNIMLEIREKLFLSNRDQLKKFII